MNKTSRMANWFISLMVLCGTAAFGLGFFRTHPMHGTQFITLLAIGIVGSRMKVKLPGFTGNMSVNLPFLLLATLELSMFEALVVALASTAAQCLPTRSGQPTRVQILFNLSMMSVAVSVASLVTQSRLTAFAGTRSGIVALILATATFFFLQTAPVATIISLTEGGHRFQIWRGIVGMSFPYYVLSAGVTTIAQTFGQVWGWEVSLVALLTMYGVYRSYVGYFRLMTTQMPALAMAKAAGH